MVSDHFVLRARFECIVEFAWSIQCLVVRRFSFVLDCMKLLNVDQFYKRDCGRPVVFLMCSHASVEPSPVGIFAGVQNTKKGVIFQINVKE